MRQYDDPVEVRKGPVGGATGEPGEEGPEPFLWRGRLWKVRSVMAHWVETGPRRAADLLVERELWRVEAGRGLPGAVAGVPGEPTSGVFDLSFSTAEDRWQLVGRAD